MRETGSIISWNQEKGFGFIRRDGKADLFLHRSALPEGLASPRSGERVSFSVERDDKGRPCAGYLLFEDRSNTLGQTLPHRRAVAPQRAPSEPRRVSRPSRRNPSLLRSLLSWGVMALLLVTLYQRLAGPELPDGRSVSGSLTTVGSRQADPSYRCDGRSYCNEMTSCEEALWFQRHCPGMNMDGDMDGIPCERQWCD
ncbi:cold shock domain-containing protein [Aeromonas diversa]|uniref:cold shock domain-containing protein n=1 Tax=Aeromonas diversa TaxID=502790 RepID=UPI0034624061